MHSKSPTTRGYLKPGIGLNHIHICTLIIHSKLLTHNKLLVDMIEDVYLSTIKTLGECGCTVFTLAVLTWHRYG